MIPTRGLPSAFFKLPGKRETLVLRVVCGVTALAFVGLGFGSIREILDSAMTPLQTTLLAIIVGGDAAIVACVFAYAALARD